MAQGRLRIENIRVGQGVQSLPHVHFQMCVHVTHKSRQELLLGNSAVARQDCLPAVAPMQPARTANGLH